MSNIYLVPKPGLEKELNESVNKGESEIEENSSNTNEGINKEELVISNVYSKLVKFTKNIVGKSIITGLLLFIVGVFYQFGYSLLYGFYFGKSISKPFHIWDITTNEIAFDIKNM